MKKNLIPNTDITVSLLGLGTVKFGRNQQVKYPKGFNLPTDNEISNLLNISQELGINLIDTAPAYGTSETRLGKLLNNRNEWIISTKVGENFIDGNSFFDFSKDATIKSVNNSLKNLNTDYLDIVLIHSNGDDKKILLETDVLSTLQDLKQAGKIRAIGMSTKTIDGGMLAVDNLDIVMVTYNPTHTDEKPVIDYAFKNNTGVFIKKALASGHIDKIANENPVKTALNLLKATPGLNSIIVGTLNIQHLRRNAEFLI